MRKLVKRAAGGNYFKYRVLMVFLWILQKPDSKLHFLSPSIVVLYTNTSHFFSNTERRIEAQELTLKIENWVWAKWTS